MTSLWRRSGIRDVAWAFAFALWCVAWPMGIVLAGASTPGAFSPRGNAGLYQMVEAVVPLPYGVSMFAWGVVACAAMWALLRLRRWLDPEGRGLASIRWALSSRSLNLMLMLLVLSAVSLIVAGEAGVLVRWLMSIDIAMGRFLASWWWLMLSIAIAILYPVVMLCLLNPHTLARDRLERWWRPFWPGIVAVLVAVLCWQLIPMLTEFAWRFLPGSVASWFPVMLLDYLIVLACDLAAFSWWFSRERASSGRGLALRLIRWPSVRLYLGFDLLVGIWVLVAAVPVVLLAVFATYVGPEYESGHGDGLLQMPMVYGVLMDVVRMVREGEWLMLGILVGDLYLAIALARLLHRSLVSTPAGEGAQGGVDGAGG